MFAICSSPFSTHSSFASDRASGVASGSEPNNVDRGLRIMCEPNIDIVKLAKSVGLW